MVGTKVFGVLVQTYHQPQPVGAEQRENDEIRQSNSPGETRPRGYERKERLVEDKGGSWMWSTRMEKPQQ